MDKLNKLAKQANIEVDMVKNIIVEDHNLNKITPKKQLKKVDVEIGGEALDKLKKIANTLKVDIDSVICALLREKIKEKHNECKKKI